MDDRVLAWVASRVMYVSRLASGVVAARILPPASGVSIVRNTIYTFDDLGYC